MIFAVSPNVRDKVSKSITPSIRLSALQQSVLQRGGGMLQNSFYFGLRSLSQKVIEAFCRRLLHSKFNNPSYIEEECSDLFLEITEHSNTTSFASPSRVSNKKRRFDCLRTQYRKIPSDPFWNYNLSRQLLLRQETTVRS